MHMNQNLLAILFGITLIASGCKKHDIPPKEGFDFNSAQGIWVPYELIRPDSSVSTGPFIAWSVFAIYDESVKINPDKSFIPVIWFDSSFFTLDSLEAGTMNYDPLNHELEFHGTWHLEFKITRYEGGELWLQTQYGMFKYRRKM